MTFEELLDPDRMKVQLARKAERDNAVHLSHVEQQEQDIALMTGVFADDGFNSFEEYDAWSAQKEMNLAKRSIKMRQEEIEKLEKFVNLCETRVQTFKLLYEKNKKRGRPERSDDKERIARKFISQWVASLKCALEVKSCGKLEDLVSLPTEESLTSERNWRRWLNGDAIPTYTTFEKLLSAKITGGKYAGKTIYDIPIPLDHNSILTLLRFI